MNEKILNSFETVVRVALNGVEAGVTPKAEALEGIQQYVQGHYIPRSALKALPLEVAELLHELCGVTFDIRGGLLVGLGCEEATLARGAA